MSMVLAVEGFERVLWVGVRRRKYYSMGYLCYVEALYEPTGHVLCIVPPTRSEARQ